MRAGGSGVDIFAFIGGSKAADLLIREHPAPHRLKVWLSLEGKNLGIVLPDADLDVAAEQVTIGSTTYNGQRCTAIKLTMVHESIAKEFLEKLKQKFAKLKYGLPWEQGVLITPLPEDKKTKSMEAMIADAVSRGASVVNSNENGGLIAGNLMVSAIVSLLILV
jgi:glyceraldehyde-3-phosphate dehydrogenase (NADP+)